MAHMQKFAKAAVYTHVKEDDKSKIIESVFDE